FAPSSLVDVRRFYLVLHPEGSDGFRLIAIGKKRLPGDDVKVERHWGFIDGVFSTPEELRRAAAGLSGFKESGEENLRPAGEGLYALRRHGNHRPRVSVLELPPSPGEVQKAFNIREEDRFVMAVKTPAATSPVGVGLELDRQPDFPEKLSALFQ